MSATKTLTWPTLDDVEPVVEAFGEACLKLDRLSIGTAGLIDREDPFEPLDGVPIPTLADVGVLTRLIDKLEASVVLANDWLEEFRQLRASASSHEAYARGAS